MAAIALGFTIPLGLLPALYASTFSPPSIFAKAWLICERLLFSTQTKRSFFFIVCKIIKRGFSPSHFFLAATHINESAAAATILSCRRAAIFHVCVHGFTIYS